MPRRTRRTYSDEQKADAVRLVKEAGSIAKVARELGIDRSVVGHWVRQAEIDAGEGPEGALTTDEKAELTRLRRQVRILEQERDFLKKAAAYFAKEPDRPSS